MSEITNQPLYLIKFDDTEVPDETMFGAEVANKRFEQISGNWNAHLFVKVASNSRDDACSGSNAKLASHYDALAAQRDEGLAREAELERENRLLRHDCASLLETMAKTLDLLSIDPESAQNAQGKPSDVLYEHAKDLQQRLAEVEEILAKAIYRQWYAAPGYVAWVERGNSLMQDQARDEARHQLASPGCADGEQPS